MRSQRDTDLLDYVHDETGPGRTYILARPSIFAQRPPPQLESWENLIDYEPPQGEPAPMKWMVIAHGDDAIPLGLGGPLNKKERENLLNDVELVAVQRAVSGASKSDIVNKWTGMSMIFMLGLAAVLTLGIMLLVLVSYVDGGDKAAGTDTAGAPAVQMPPTPTPDGWQNPRPAQ